MLAIRKNGVWTYYLKGVAMTREEVSALSALSALSDATY